MRLQVFLSRAGLCSRRDAMSLIQSGQVAVNGVVCREPSMNVDGARDKIIFKGEPVLAKEKKYILLNKPQGVMTTREDKFAVLTVLDLLPKEYRHLFPVGRLDKDTTGLLLLTNDGELTHRMTHPSFETKKNYVARLNKRLIEKDRLLLERGILLEGKMTASCSVIQKKSGEVEIVLREGRKRQIRKMFACLHYHVKELKRVKEGPLSLGSLKLGAWRLLTKEEVERLYKEVKLS